MKNFRNIFQYISYLQYPFGILVLLFSYKPLIFGIETFWTDLNTSLIFMGLAVSFSTLQDTTKVQNKFSKRVWENPKYAKAFLIYLSFMILIIFSFGLYGYFFPFNESVAEVSLGAIVLGIGLIGMLKTGLEMAEYHGKQDKKTR